MDNGGQSVINNLSLELENLVTGRGLRITVEGLEADGFWVAGTCTKILGFWIPNNDIETGGSIQFGYLLLEIKLRIGGGHWWPIPIGNGFGVEIEGEEEMQMEEGTSVQFQTVTYGGTAPYTYTWTLPQGATSEASNPVYTFNIPGTYLISVLVTDRAGCVGVAFKPVKVNSVLYGTIAL